MMDQVIYSSASGNANGMTDPHHVKDERVTGKSRDDQLVEQAAEVADQEGVDEDDTERLDQVQDHEKDLPTSENEIRPVVEMNQDDEAVAVAGLADDMHEPTIEESSASEAPTAVPKEEQPEQNLKQQVASESTQKMRIETFDGDELGPVRSIVTTFDGDSHRGSFRHTLMEKMTRDHQITGKVPPVTDRFVACMKGNVELGRIRWEQTLKWRVANNINNLVRSQQPYFERIKKHYPHFLHGKSKEGHNIYIEQVGKIDLKGLYKDGVTFEGLMNHYIFVAEFLYTYITPEEAKKTITIIDCAHLTLRKLPGDVMKFIRAANHLLGEHYPERAAHVYIINVPLYFSLLWKLIHPFIDKTTLKKIKVIRGKNAVQNALLEHIDINELPPEYGGKSPYALGQSKEELLLANVVQMLNDPDNHFPENKYRIHT